MAAADGAAAGAADVSLAGVKATKAAKAQKAARARVDLSRKAGIMCLMPNSDADVVCACALKIVE